MRDAAYRRCSMFQSTPTSLLKLAALSVGWLLYQHNEVRIAEFYEFKQNRQLNLASRLACTRTIEDGSRGDVSLASVSYFSLDEPIASMS